MIFPESNGSAPHPASQPTSQSSHAQPAQVEPIHESPIDEITIQLLEERIVVNQQRRKVGDVIVRKVIETEVVTVQVPRRWERLIVEQTGAEPKILATIDLYPESSLQQTGDLYQAQESDTVIPPSSVLESPVSDSSSQRQTVTDNAITANFASVQDASQFLSDLAPHISSDRQQVEVKLSIANPALLADVLAQYRK